MNIDLRRYGKMGSVKPRYIKRLSDEFMEKHDEKFTGDFDHNKKLLNELSDIHYKKLRNRIAGLITKKINRMNRIKKELNEE